VTGERVGQALVEELAHPCGTSTSCGGHRGGAATQLRQYANDFA
jgi:hypothetical protein